jgi:hypothetical protein
MKFLCPANEFRLKSMHGSIRDFQALKHSLTSFCEVCFCLQSTENQVLLSKLSNSGGGGHVGKLQLVCVLAHGHGAAANSIECQYTVHVA